VFFQCTADVIKLTAENFDQHVDGSSNILVEFYAPWYVLAFLALLYRITTNIVQLRCGHCKNLEPEWQIAGETFKSEE
jgi:hypothetical protein